MRSDSQPTATNRSPSTGDRFRTGPVVLLSVTHLIHDTYTSFLAPLLPLIIKKLSLSLTSAGLLTTVMQLPALVNPFIGAWADRISVRWFVIAAPTLTAVPMSLIGMAPNYAILMILLFVAGISVSLFHVPAPVMVAKLSGPHKGRGMSFFMTGGELARTVGPLAAVGAVSCFGLEGIYPVMSVGIIASAWLYISLKEVAINTTGKKPIPLKETWREMRRLMLPLMAILAARGFMHASIVTFLPTFITQQTSDLWLAGISLTLVEGAGVAGILAAGPVSDLFGRRRVLLVSLIGAPIALLGFIWLDGWIRFGALLVTGFTLLSTTPVMLAMVQEHSISSPAASNGLFMMASFTARSTIVVLVGLMGDLAGLEFTYICSALLGFVGIPFILMLPASRH